MSNKLIIDKDAESNPRSTNVVEKQCVGRFIKVEDNYLHALSWSQIKTVTVRNGSDLDHVLLEGEFIRFTNTSDIFPGDDLPYALRLNDRNVNIDIQVLKSKIPTRKMSK